MQMEWKIEKSIAYPLNQHKPNPEVTTKNKNKKYLVIPVWLLLKPVDVQDLYPHIPT